MLLVFSIDISIILLCIGINITIMLLYYCSIILVL